jgi:hypothetical protein
MLLKVEILAYYKHFPRLETANKSKHSPVQYVMQVQLLFSTCVGLTVLKYYEVINF